MNEKWFAACTKFDIKNSVITLLFGENNANYYGRVYPDDKFKKCRHKFELTVLTITERYEYKVIKEYESFADVLIDYPELIDL